MRVSIVVDDNLIVGDGSAHKVDLSPLVEDHIWAVQWYGTHGEVEFRPDAKGDMFPNEKITDLSPFEPYINLWRQQKEIDDKRTEEFKLEMENQRRIAEETAARANAEMAKMLAEMEKNRQ